jgi:hypothetical protein
MGVECPDFLGRHGGDVVPYIPFERIRVEADAEVDGREGNVWIKCRLLENDWSRSLSCTKLESIFFLPGGSISVGIEPVHRALEYVAFQHQLDVVKIGE